jgi:cell division cycle protein 20 (cofactor of APC complex)
MLVVTLNSGMSKLPVVRNPSETPYKWEVAILSRHQNILTSGCGASARHHDARIPRHEVMELLGHTGEVCGLKQRKKKMESFLRAAVIDNIVNRGWQAWRSREGMKGRNRPRGISAASK